MADIRAIESDWKLAEKYLNSFKDETLSELNARGKMFQHAVDAIQEFKILKEEEKLDDWSAILSGALTVLSVVPGFGITAFLAKQASTARIAYKAAKIFGTKVPTSAKVVRTIDQVRKDIKNIKGSVEELELQEKVTSIRDALEATDKMINREPSDAAEKLDSELSARLAVIKDLIQADRERLDAFNHAWASVYLKYKFRLYDIDPQPSETLTAFAMKLLAIPQRYNAEPGGELDQLALLYQWEAMKRWAAMHVTVIETVQVGGGRHGQSSFEFDGMNSAQWAWAYSTFGPRAARGRIFAEPPLMLPDTNGWVLACRRWNAKYRRVNREYRGIAYSR